MAEAADNSDVQKPIPTLREQAESLAQEVDDLEMYIVEAEIDDVDLVGDLFPRREYPAAYENNYARRILITSFIGDMMRDRLIDTGVRDIVQQAAFLQFVINTLITVGLRDLHELYLVARTGDIDATKDLISDMYDKLFRAFRGKLDVKTFRGQLELPGMEETRDSVGRTTGMELDAETRNQLGVSQAAWDSLSGTAHRVTNVGGGTRSEQNPRRRRRA